MCLLIDERIMRAPKKNETQIMIYHTYFLEQYKYKSIKEKCHSSSQSQFIYWDSKLFATLQLLYIQFLPGQSEQKSSVCCIVHTALPKWPIHQFKPVQQSRQQTLRAYCPNEYTVILDIGHLTIGLLLFSSCHLLFTNQK